MPLTTYCVEADIERIWSAEGLDYRADYNGDGQNNADVITDVIEETTEDINVYLLERYTAATLATSAWVTRKCAFLAAYELALKRGNSPPESWERKREELLLLLDEIHHRRKDVPGIIESANRTPAMSNLHMDMRYNRSKIRVVPSISTGGLPQGAATQKTDNYDRGEFG